MLASTVAITAISSMASLGVLLIASVEVCGWLDRLLGWLEVEKAGAWKGFSMGIGMFLVWFRGFLDL